MFLSCKYSVKITNALISRTGGIVAKCLTFFFFSFGKILAVRS